MPQFRRSRPPASGGNSPQMRGLAPLRDVLRERWSLLTCHQGRTKRALRRRGAGIGSSQHPCCQAIHAKPYISNPIQYMQPTPIAGSVHCRGQAVPPSLQGGSVAWLSITGLQDKLSCVSPSSLALPHSKAVFPIPALHHHTCNTLLVHLHTAVLHIPLAWSRLAVHTRARGQPPHASLVL